MKNVDFNDYMAMLDLICYLHSEPSAKNVSDYLKTHLDKGLDRLLLQETLQKYIENMESKNNLHYMELLEDMVFALDGQCSINYKLHPNYAK